MGTNVHRPPRADGDVNTLRFELRDWKREDGAAASRSSTWTMIRERLDHDVVDGRVDPHFLEIGDVY